MQAREAVAKWIEEKRQEKDAPALTWLLQRTAFALLTCYPPGQGGDVLWATFKMLAGAELEARGKAEGEQGRLLMGEEG